MDFFLPNPPSIFAGRENELKRLTGGFEKLNVLIIDGMAGIGKTSLALTLGSAIISNNKFFREDNILWITCEEYWELENIFYEINRWLKYREIYSFEECLEDNRLSKEERVNYLIKILNEHICAVFIDDYHKLKSSSSNILIECSVRNLKNSRLIIISRERPSISPLFWFEIFEQKVEILDDNSSIKLIQELLKLRGDKFSESLAEEINRFVGGHTFLIKTILSLYLSGNHNMKELYDNRSIFWKSTENYLQKIMEMLGEKERDLLTSASLFRIPVKRKAFSYIYTSEDLDTIAESLEKKFLLIRYSDDKYTIHDLIKNFCLSSLSSEKRKIIHNLCSNYYISLIDNRDKKLFLGKEAFYHYIEGGNIDKAVRILEDIAGEMMEYLQIKELEEYIDLIPSEYRSQKIIIARSELFCIKEDYKGGLEFLQDINCIDDLFLAGHVSNSKARCYKGLKNYEEALKVIDITLGEYKDSQEYLSFYIEALQIKGEIYFECSNYDEALDCFNKALDINIYLRDKFREINLLLFKGMSIAHNGQVNEALYIHFKALKMAEETDNVKEIASIKLNIGWDYYESGEFDMACKFLLEGIEIAYTARLKVYGFYFMSLIYEEKEEYETSLRYISEALELSLMLKDIEKQFTIKTILARLYLKSGKYNEAREIILENKYIINDLYHNIKMENLLLYSELELIDGKVMETLDLIKNILKKYDDLGDFQLCRLYYLLGILSKDDREEGLIKFQSHMSKLFGNKRRRALNHILYLDKLLFARNNGKSGKENYLVKLSDEEYYTNYFEVEKLKAKMNSFELFIDVTNGKVWEREKGFINFKQKRNLSILLFHFVKNAGLNFSIEELYEQVWGNKFNKLNDSTTVKTSISRLRKLLESAEGDMKYIKLYTACSRQSRYYFPGDINYCYIEEHTGKGV